MGQGVESRKLRKFFTPITIGNLELANRIVMPAIHLSYTPQRIVTDTLIDFHAGRAAGRVGLLILGGRPVDEYAAGPFMVGLRQDRFVPGLTRLTPAVHEPGAPLAAQLYHAGRYSHWRWFRPCANLLDRASPSSSA